jgi:hypothetical protein
MRRFSRIYGSSPAHLLLALGAFAVAGYAALRAFEKGPPLAQAGWFVGAIVSHDLVLLPLYSLTLLGLLLAVGGSAARRGRPLSPARALVLNHLRVPAALSLLLLLLFFPLVLGLSEGGYRAASGLSTEPFLERWLLLSAALFALSGAVLVIRLDRARRREPGGGTRGGEEAHR